MAGLEQGTKEHHNHSGLVPLSGQLPLCLELPTPKVLDVILALHSKTQNQAELKTLRKKLNERLYPRTRPGSYLEVNENLHLAYMGQPDGHGKQHWWRLFFVEALREQIEAVVHGSALAVSDKVTSQPPGGATREWGGLYLRSEAEVRIAQALDRRRVLFFANCRGRVSDAGSPVSASKTNGRVEVDFLVFVKGRGMILEIDGLHHNAGSQTERDYGRDRLLLREGIPTARFTAQECYTQPTDVVSEFLNLFGD
jgi:Protein of unknown function (DUF559)